MWVPFAGTDDAECGRAAARHVLMACRRVDSAPDSVSEPAGQAWQGRVGIKLASGDGWGTPDEGSAGDGPRYYKRDFWEKENLSYAQPHFRLEKSARVINRLARGRDLDLLDIGCGPATLKRFLDPNIHYHGIDIAVQDPDPTLIESDLMENPVEFHGKKFDIILAQGFFEYAGALQEQKFAEIRNALKDSGTFVLTYVNFSHRNTLIYWPYSNVQQTSDFRRSLSRFFDITRSFPTSHNWNHTEPNRRFMTVSQMHLNVTIPILSPKLAVEYFYICTPKA
jgi:SAM-dependent methyltransferase